MLSYKCMQICCIFVFKQQTTPIALIIKSHLFFQLSLWHEHLQWYSQFIVAQVVHLRFIISYALFGQPHIFIIAMITNLIIFPPFYFHIWFSPKAGCTYKSNHYQTFPLSEQSISHPQLMHLKWHGDNSSIKSKHFRQIFFCFIL